MNIEKVDVTNIDNSSNCLELMIIILSKSLNLEPKKTITLFAENNKYL